MTSNMKNNWNTKLIYHLFGMFGNEYGGYYYVLCILDNIHIRVMFDNMPNMSNIEKGERRLNEFE